MINIFSTSVVGDDAHIVPTALPHSHQAIVNTVGAIFNRPLYKQYHENQSNSKENSEKRQYIYI